MILQGHGQLLLDSESIGQSQTRRSADYYRTLTRGSKTTTGPWGLILQLTRPEQDGTDLTVERGCIALRLLANLLQLPGQHADDVLVRLPPSQLHTASPPF